VATLTEVKPVPHYNLAVSDAEINLLRSALIVMRNVKYAEGRPSVDLLRGQVSIGQANDALRLLDDLRK